MASAGSERRQSDTAGGAAAGGLGSGRRQRSAGKEPAPIIIHKDEQFVYKAPSTVHEAVVHTLRREKDHLSVALGNQRESANAMAARMA